MDLHDVDDFTVYVRMDPNFAQATEDIEVALGNFHTYADALQAQRAYQRPARECVIRYRGHTGGGD